MSVHDDVIPLFEDKAKAIVEKKGGIWAVAAALAVISGNTEPLKERSLLNSSQGHFTLMIHSKPNANVQDCRSSTPLWGFIRRYIYYSGDDDRVKGLVLTADKQGGVFDVPSSDKDRIMDLMSQISDPRWELSVPTVLPQLEVKDLPQERQGGGGRFSANRGGWSRGGNGGGGNGGGNGGGFGGRSRMMGNGRNGGFGGRR